MRIPLSFSLRKSAGNHFRAIGEYFADLPPRPQRLDHTPQWTKRQFIFNIVKNPRTRTLRSEPVSVPPYAIGPSQLHIHELPRRLPAFNQRRPFDRHAIKLELIIDARPRLQPNRTRRQNMKVKVFGSNRLQIICIRKECEDFLHRPFQPLLCMEMVHFASNPIVSH